MLPLLNVLVGIEVDAERVFLELGGKHVRGGLFGGVEAVDLRLEVVAVGIAVVDGERGAVVDGPERLDVVRLALRVRLQQVVDGLVCEAHVLEAGGAGVLGLEAWDCHKCDAVVLFVVRYECQHSVVCYHSST